MRQLKITKSITSREDSSLDKYLQEIGRVPLVTVDEEIELAKRIKAGDKEALDKLAKANLRFVVSVAKQYQNQGLSLPDLINEGNYGLIKAAQRFDETRGFKFISYAVWWIRQSILQALAESSRIVKLPNNKVLGQNKVKKEQANFEKQNERRATAEEIAEILNISEDKVTDVVESYAYCFSIEQCLNDNGDTYLDVTPDEDSPKADGIVINESLVYEIQRSLNTLSERDREVIRMHFGFGSGVPMTYYQIAEKMNLTSYGVKRIKENAIRRLRSSSRSKILRQFLG